MKPYIFLSENYLQYTIDSNNEQADLRDIAASTPYDTTIYFADRYGNIVNRTIDTLILQGTNIANMTIEAATEESESESESDDGYTPILTLANNTDSTVILKAAQPVTTSSIRIIIPDATNPANVVAKIGVYGFICNLCALTDSNYKITGNEGSFRVVNGDYIHWADYKKWVGKVKIDNLPKAQFDLLTQQADTGTMTVIPYTDLEAEAIYACAVKREYSWELDRKTELFKLDLEFNEL
jgi:hypothetical protein